MFLLANISIVINAKNPVLGFSNKCYDVISSQVFCHLHEVLGLKVAQMSPTPFWLSSLYNSLVNLNLILIM